MELIKLFESYDGNISKEDIVHWAIDNDEIIEFTSIENMRQDNQLGKYIGHGHESLAVYKKNSYVYKIFEGRGVASNSFLNLKYVLTNFNRFFPENKYSIEKVAVIVEKKNNQLIWNKFYPILKQKAAMKTFDLLDINSLSKSTIRSIKDLMAKKGFYEIEPLDRVSGMAFINNEGQVIDDIKPKNIGIDSNGKLMIFDVLFR